MARDDGLDDVETLLIDGDNLLHHVRGSRDEGGVAWLLPRLSDWRPAHVRIVVALDGHPATGESSRRRIARGIEFHHSGSRSADDLLISLLSAQPYAERARTVVVTRDRALAGKARSTGGRTRSVDWLLDLLTHRGGADPSRTPGPPTGRAIGIGQGKPPPPRASEVGPQDGSEREPWQPGRGATRKRGNPRRRAKHLRRR